MEIHHEKDEAKDLPSDGSAARAQIWSWSSGGREGKRWKVWKEERVIIA